MMLKGETFDCLSYLATGFIAWFGIPVVWVLINHGHNVIGSIIAVIVLLSLGRTIGHAIRMRMVITQLVDTVLKEDQ